MTYVTGFPARGARGEQGGLQEDGREDLGGVPRPRLPRDARELGADVPDGTVTSFPMAVKKEADEVVVFSWMEWPDRRPATAPGRP
jgi:hypothetical protein